MRWRDRRPAQVAVAITVAAQPERDRAADDGSSGERAEIAAVETVGNARIQQQDLVFADHPAAPPDRQIAASAVAGERGGGRDAVDGDSAADTANLLSRQRGDTLQQRHAGAGIAARGDESGDRLWRIDRDQIADRQVTGGPQGIEPERHAGAGVPDQRGRDVGDGDAADHQHSETGCGKISDACPACHDAPP